jgi:hypothetical protein
MPTPETTLALLAVEYWKLLRVIERALETVPEDGRDRIASTVRYASSRLDALLLEQNISLQAFDGMPFEVNLPASAINADEFQEGASSVVERTLEPAVVSNMRILLMGKVVLTREE